jgi:hypothetical protein
MANEDMLGLNVKYGVMTHLANLIFDCAMFYRT